MKIVMEEIQKGSVNNGIKHKRIGIIVLLLMAVLLQCSYGDSTSGRLLSKDQPSEWAREQIEQLRVKKILSDSAFGDYKSGITRGEGIKYLVAVYENMIGSEIPVLASAEFSDTKEEYPLKASSAGISSGVGDGKFGGAIKINRETFAALLVKMAFSDVRYSDVNGSNSSAKSESTQMGEVLKYVDDVQISAWAKAAVYKLNAIGIMKGVGENKFDPKGALTKEQVLLLMNKVVDKRREVSHPRVFQPWAVVENLDELSDVEKIAKHDLIFSDTWLLDFGWAISEEQPYPLLESKLDLGEIEKAKAKYLAIKKANPDIVILCSLLYREGRFVEDQRNLDYWERGDLPPDSKYFLREKDGKVAPGWGEDKDGDGVVEEDEIEHGLIDFTDPEFQDIIAAKAKALKDSGLFDGIMMDWWNETNATTGNLDWSKTYLTKEQEVEARVNILKKIRGLVGDDFLIMVNANKNKVPLSAPYINGLYMEAGKDDYAKGYTADELKKIEETLYWAEGALKEPHINGLEGWRVVNDYDGDIKSRVADRNTDENMRWMRLFTTMSLTHSDGYVLFSDDNTMPSEDHLHNWYDFWDIDLGMPVGEKRVTYNGRDGVFIREFEKGYAVYNRTGSNQAVRFDSEVTDVVTGKSGTMFIVGAVDGMVLLK